MYKIIKAIVGTTISFALTNYFLTSFQLDNSLTSYLLTAILFLLVNLFVSPILKLILFPINLLTLGIFRWVVNVLVLYIFDLLYAGLTIAGTGSDYLLTLVLSSLMLSLSYAIFTLFVRE
jgi:putative membrane protein